MTVFQHPALEEIDAISPLLEEVGLALECDPEDWGRLWDHDLLRAITLMEVPDGYNPVPNCGGLFGAKPITYGIQVAIAERMARFDPNCILSLPTPSMSGYAIRVLGNPDQIDSYFSRYAGKPQRSFFAITEPHVGSDATAGASCVADRAGQRRLTAHKKLVGSAAQADFGLVFARDERTRSHKLVVAQKPMIAKMDIARLQTHGLAGADLSEIKADDLAIDDGAILGAGMTRGLRDGFYAMNSVFERYRPVVSTLAIGVARGILDRLSALGISRGLLEPYYLRHSVFLGRLDEIACAYEAGLQKVHETSRLKFDAIAFIDEVVSLVFRHVPSRDLFQNPGLIKKCRDAKAFEYMEGTSHIHAIHAFRSYAASV